MIIPDGFAQVNVLLDGAGVRQNAQWTFGVDVTLGPATPALLGAQVITALTDSTLMTNFSSSVRIRGVLVKFGPNATGPSAEVSANIPGTLGALSTPPNFAVLVQKRTALGGRSGRGRVYLPGVLEASVTEGGLIDTTLVNNIQADMTSFHGKMIANDTPIVLLHGSPDAPISTPIEVESFLVQQTGATQRRRLRR